MPSRNVILTATQFLNSNPTSHFHNNQLNLLNFLQQQQHNSSPKSGAFSQNLSLFNEAELNDPSQTAAGVSSRASLTSNPPASATVFHGNTRRPLQQSSPAHQLHGLDDIGGGFPGEVQFKPVNQPNLNMLNSSIPINSSILKWNSYYNQRASVVGFRLVPLFKTQKGSSYRHLWFTLQTEFESFNRGNFSQIKTGRTKALLDTLHGTGSRDLSEDLCHRRLIAKLCSETVEASKPESRAIPEELKDNTSNNVLEGDYTQEPEAFTISQYDELDKTSQSLSIDAKPNRNKGL
ncbi:hypothetical protein BY996DRAFT_6588586 [Phakopsora pachyrhizi]|nr:hypothetical protein BY996DRAFT_6588586 [Phakopsora pachyrhizi]